MNILPSRFLRITSPHSQLVKRLERIRTSKLARKEEGHVLVQGIKTLEELSSRPHHRIRTIGITFDEHTLPIRAPALDVVSSVRQQEKEEREAETQKEIELDVRQGQRRDSSVWRKGTTRKRSGRLEADLFVATSRKLTNKILGTNSLAAEHEVWAEVAIPNHEHLFSTATNTGSRRVQTPGSTSATEIQRLLVLDQISDPGNMGLIIRSAKALSWDAAWHTPGTVDQYNDKVVRASRALCLDWPTKTAGWKELEQFLENHGLTLLVADMVPRSISHPSLQQEQNRIASQKFVDPYNLVWWNWPSSLPQTHIPERMALVMSSEHHGVRAAATKPGSKTNKPTSATNNGEEQEAKARLMSKAIRVSIPMNPAVESMNVAAAATAMMWELNRAANEIKRSPESKIQVFDTSE
ncbi:hypothetical protein EDD21DRAFT_386211 [Dissophora ornata]|nr:hypothetical protein BGZ58_010671 [Dissophora ornata]KAI8597133.1 hypothetical protein EDD21DRAFT_386211 [Dissophora ornata]